MTPNLKPLVSIITVCYLSERTIEDTILSVISQDYPFIEYIIVDGNSIDNTVQIIEKYDKYISKKISEPDNGIYDAMNKGILLATGDIIGILNSDDIFYDTEVLADVISEFEKCPELDILYGDLNYVSKDNINKVVRNWVSKQYHDSFFEDGNVPPHPTLFLRSRVYKEVGLFDLKYKLAADYEFMLRIFKKYSFKSRYINRLIVKMRLGGVTNKKFINIFLGNKEILSSWKNNGLKIPPQLVPLRIIKRLIQFIQ